MSEVDEGPRRRLMIGWAVSAVLVLAGVVLLLLTRATLPGLLLFLLGGAGIAVVTVGFLRLRAGSRE